MYLCYAIAMKRERFINHLKNKVMYLFILVLFLCCWFAISLYAMILNSESDGDTVKETLTKFFIVSFLWILLIVFFAILII